MVREQLVARRITDSNILASFLNIPRHLFVSEDQRELAYTDQPLPISNGQTISQPYVVALMLEYLESGPEMDVLEIGGGSGYATALLSQLFRHVHSIEVFSELMVSAQKVLSQLELKNISLEHRSAWEQSTEQKLYSRIILWASPPRIPEYLFDHLDEGGIMVAPEGKHDQTLWVIKKKGGNLIKEKKESVRFVPLMQGKTTEIDRYR